MLSLHDGCFAEVRRLNGLIAVHARSEFKEVGNDDQSS